MQNEMALASRYFREAVKYSRLSHDTVREAITYCKLVVPTESQDQKDSLLQKALLLAKQTDSKVALCLTYYGLAELALERKDYSRALDYLNDAEQYTSAFPEETTSGDYALYLKASIYDARGEYAGAYESMRHCNEAVMRKHSIMVSRQSEYGAMADSLLSMSGVRVVKGNSTSSNSNEKAVDNFVQHYTSYPAYCNVTGTCSVDEAGNKVTVDTDTEFAVDCDVPHSLHFVLVEDKVGPYKQSNYYAGGENGVMGGWEDKESTQNTYFNDVARVYDTFGGVENSIPASVKANTKYSFSREIDMSECTGFDVKDRRVIVFITNDETGSIINACKVELASTGIGEIESEAPATEEYYNLQGIRVNPDNCESGIYIVRKNGKTYKQVLKH